MTHDRDPTASHNKFGTRRRASANASAFVAIITRLLSLVVVVVVAICWSLLDDSHNIDNFCRIDTTTAFTTHCSSSFDEATETERASTALHRNIITTTRGGRRTSRISNTRYSLRRTLVWIT
jgi:hypothetical protein